MFKSELKRLRHLAFFTQKELCLRSGVPLGTYKSWEVGLQLPSHLNWQKYINFMQTTNAKYELKNVKELYNKCKK